MWGEGSKDGWIKHSEKASSGRAGADPARPEEAATGSETPAKNRPRQSRALSRSRHGFGVVVGEWVIQPGPSLPAAADRRRRDDPIGNLRRCPCRRHTDALLPQAQVAEDVPRLQRYAQHCGQVA
jgi:hypothetical protein